MSKVDLKCMYTIEEAADALDASSRHVIELIGQDQLIGFESAQSNGIILPAAQFKQVGDDDRRVIPIKGIHQVLGSIKDHKLTWAFLSTPWDFLGSTQRPLSRLRQGNFESVLDAADTFVFGSF